MNKITIYSLKALRKIYTKVYGKALAPPECLEDPETVSEIIYNSLMSDTPCMIARFGSNELNTLLNYQGVNKKSRSISKYIKGEQFDWWWNEGIIKNLHDLAGFFPITTNKLEQFCELMMKDIPEVDILGSWLANEHLVEVQLKHAIKVHLRLLEPYWANNFWSKALEGKKVLVIHPFVEDIEKQFLKRELLFKNSILPSFQLTTIKAVLSLANEETGFKDWFEALDHMKAEIDKVDYDICLIGCGAYGFHLAAHVKRRGKKGFHFGGALQLLFGIRGKRWEDPNYGVKEWGIPNSLYSNLMNEHWIRPNNNDKPKNANIVEDGCYW
jgi:hypothetical protein